MQCARRTQTEHTRAIQDQHSKGDQRVFYEGDARACDRDDRDSLRPRPAGLEHQPSVLAASATIRLSESAPSGRGSAGLQVMVSGPAYRSP